jgi:hypothetical protein
MPQASPIVIAIGKRVDPDEDSMVAADFIARLSRIAADLVHAAPRLRRSIAHNSAAARNVERCA